MLRLALSPTGDMHIGDLRVALFNAIVAKQRGEPLVVRIEDTDIQRNIEGKDKEILETLALFGIEYSDVVYQSNSLRYHRAMTIQLLHDKKAFNCFCTPDELKRKREFAIEQGVAYHYDDTCRYLRPEETIDNENPFTIRLTRPDDAIKVTDIIKGEIVFEPQEVDSFNIMSAEKYPTYDFACAVDDMLSDISIIIRDEEHLSGTPRQIAVRDALGYDKEIEYAHLPDILDDAGKREGVPSVRWLLEEGYLPEAIANYLILLGNKTPEEVFTVAEALEWSDLSELSPSPVRFDMGRLKSLNREHLKRMEAKELSRYVGFADDDIGEVAKLYLEEAGTLKELRSKITPIFAEKQIPEALEGSAKKLREAIGSAPFFEEFDGLHSYLMKETGLQDEGLSRPLRLLLSGTEHGPELSDLYVHLKNYLEEIVK